MEDTTENFKTQLKTKVIPVVEKLIKKEKEHIVYLKNQKAKLSSNWFTKIFNRSISIFIDHAIERSNIMLNHYQTRLKDYIEFSEKE